MQATQKHKPPQYWPFVIGIHMRMMGSPDKGPAMHTAFPCIDFTMDCVRDIHNHQLHTEIRYVHNGEIITVNSILCNAILCIFVTATF